MDGWKTTFLLGWPIFGGYVNGWDVITFFLAASLPKNAGHINMHSKKKSRFTADLSLGGEGFYTGTFNRLEIQSVELLVIFHCIPWLFIISNAKTIYLHWLFAWSKQDTISQSPVISHPFHGWTRHLRVPPMEQLLEDGLGPVPPPPCPPQGGSVSGSPKIPKWLVGWRRTIRCFMIPQFFILPRI